MPLCKQTLFLNLSHGKIVKSVANSVTLTIMLYREDDDEHCSNVSLKQNCHVNYINQMDYKDLLINNVQIPKTEI